MRIGGITTYPRLFVVVSFICLAIPFFVLKQAIAGVGISVSSLIISSLVESLIFLLPLIWIKGKWRYSVLLPLLLIPAYLYISLLYFRNFNDTLSAPLHSWRAVNVFAIEGGLTSVRPSDIIILLAYLVPPAMLAVRHSSIICNPFGRRFKILYIVVAVMMAAAEFTLQARRYVIVRSELPDDVVTALREYPAAWNAPSECMSAYMVCYGLGAYWVKIVCLAHESRTLELTAGRRAAIESVLASSCPPLPRPLADSLSENRNRNMVVIVVESLSSEVLRLPYINNVAPTLSALASDSASFVATDLMVLAGKGRSADGQLMLNTGLLPLSSEPFAMAYGSADYPSLAKALPRHFAVEIIAEPQSLWNHGATSRSYGYRKLISDVARDGIDQDSIVLDRAASVVRSLSRPFLLQVSTISMHDSYTRPRVTPVPGAARVIPDGTDSRDREYLLRLAHFDSALTRLLASLRVGGLIDSTVIVITGDHEPNREAISRRFWCDCVPLVIVGSGVGGRVSRKASQLDIFPTLLDVMAVEQYALKPSGRPYRGMGCSLLRPAHSSVDTSAMHRGADLVFRTRYFGESYAPR